MKFRSINLRMNSDDALAWIARSVVLICGSAFIFVCGALGLRWYGHFRVLGHVEKVHAYTDQGPSLDNNYWKEFLLAHLQADSFLYRKDLQQLQQQLRETGYFSELQLSLSQGILQIYYQLESPLAMPMQVSSSNRWCLYSSAKVLPYLGENLPEDLCVLYLDEQSENTTALVLATAVLKTISMNNALKGWRCREIDIRGFDDFNDPASEMVLGMRKADRLIYVRLGVRRLQKLTWLGTGAFTRVLDLAEHKGSDYLDARLEDLLVMGCQKKEEH